MRPATGTTVQTPVLAQHFSEYVEAAAQRLAGLQALPLVNVDRKAGDIMVMTREAKLKVDLDAARAPGGTYNRVEWNYERFAYACTEKGQEMLLDDSEVSENEKYMEITRNSTTLMIDYLLRRQEIEIATELFNATTFSGYTGDINANEWDDLANATPYKDCNDVYNTMLGNCGMRPTDLLMSDKVFRNLIQIDEITDRLQYTAPNQILPYETQRQLISNYLGVNIVVAGAWYDAALEGASASLSEIWDDEYILFYVRSTGVGMPGIGWTLNWTGDSPSNANVESYREEQTRGNVLRVRHHNQVSVFQPIFGYLAANVTA